MNKFLGVLCLIGASQAVTLEGQITQIPDQLRNMPGFDNMLLDVLVQLEGAPGTSQWTQLLPSGKFVFFNVPAANSYVISAGGASLKFRPVRVDVNSKGSMRARELDRIDPHKIEKLPYPIQLRFMGMPQFFHKRAKIDILGMIMGNPMVLMMGVSFLLMMVLPKMTDMNDPEMKKQMDESMSWMKPKAGQSDSMPDVAEMMSNWFGPGPPKTKRKNK